MVRGKSRNPQAQVHNWAYYITNTHMKQYIQAKEYFKTCPMIKQYGIY